MRPHIVAMALVLTGAAGRARAANDDARAYEAARRGFYALKAGAGKGGGREAWIAAAARFELVAKSFPQSDKAPLALYTAAELRNQLSRVSLTSADRQAAYRDYDQVARLYPKSKLADDALYQVARISLDRENEPERARAALTDLLQRYPKSDMASRARKLLAHLPDPQPKPRAAKPAVARLPNKSPAPASGHGSAPQAATTPAAGSEGDEDDDDTADDEGPATADEALREGKPSPAKPHESVDAKAREPSEDTSPSEDEDEPGKVALPGVERVASEDQAPRSGTSAKAPSRRADWHGLIDALRRAGPAPGGVPLAVQMGLRVRRVVIDAGHGGHDSGAIGPDGTQEKDVTLAVAQKLAQDLKAQGLEVLLTRNDDRFVSLDDRAAFANKVKADLFISIHCNAARNRKLRGTETYFLNVTDDRYALRLAARENQASEKSLSDLQLILADMATKADVEESERLARSVQHTLVDGSRDAGRHDLGVKHALFYVLLGTRMPSVLVETAFLSNPQDERKLRSDKYQSELARAISQGVGQFLDRRQGLADAVP